MIKQTFRAYLIYILPMLRSGHDSPVQHNFMTCCERPQQHLHSQHPRECCECFFVEQAVMRLFTRRS